MRKLGEFLSFPPKNRILLEVPESQMYKNCEWANPSQAIDTRWVVIGKWMKVLTLKNPYPPAMMWIPNLPVPLSLRKRRKSIRSPSKRKGALRGKVLRETTRSNLKEKAKGKLSQRTRNPRAIIFLRTPSAVCLMNKPVCVPHWAPRSRSKLKRKQSVLLWKISI
jgi:hypothetical protein